VVDLIKQRKLTLFGYICRTNDNRLMKTVMLGMVEGDRRLAEDQQRDGMRISWNGVLVRCQLVQLASNRQRWRELTGLSGSHGP